VILMHINHEMLRLCERATGTMNSRSQSFVTELRKARWSFFVLQLPKNMRKL